MSLNIIQELRSKSPQEATRIIGNASLYIKNDNFVNLLNQFNLNHNKHNKKDIINDLRLGQQFNMFVGIPELKEQILKWLQS